MYDDVEGRGNVCVWCMLVEWGLVWIINDTK